MTRKSASLALAALAGALLSTAAEARFGNQRSFIPQTTSPLFGNHTVVPPVTPPLFGNHTTTTTTTTQPLFGNQTIPPTTTNQPLFGNHVVVLPPPLNHFGNHG